MKLNWRILGFGFLLSAIDVIAMPIMKGVATRGWTKWLMFIPTILYASDPWIFLQSLSGETMVVMNLLWDLMSDILVTIIGLVFWGEHIPGTKMAGVILSFISLFLMSYEGDGWGEYMENFFKKLAV